jgi:hypothetical protein
MAVLLVGLFSLPALAQYTKDKAAKQKIDEAINQQYLMMELDKAEATLKGTIAACGDKCSPKTLAEAWMYVGIVRGSGRNDQAGAAEAFNQARALDPKVKLDGALATPETQQTFAAAGGSAVAAPETPAARPGGDDEEDAIPGDMLCSPEVRQVETRRPIPVSCETEEDGKKAELKFKVPGGDWQKIAMKKVGGAWQAEIPCDQTNNPGALLWYVQVTDSIDEVVDSLGSRKQPVEIRLVESSSEAAPAFPGKSAPARCASASDCPPGFPGCGESKCGDKDWGVACDNSSECKCGLLCVDGACETAPSCETDDECESGSCVNGTCAAGAESSSGKKRKHWVGVHGAMDFMMMGSFKDACALDVQDRNNLACYALGDSYPLEGESPQVPPGTSGGFAPAQIRALLSYELMLGDKMSLGLRAGYAFNGPPKSFLPVHAEGRFSYYFLGNDKPGLRPYAHLGGGLADVQGLVTKNNVTSCFAPGDCSDLNIKIYQQSGPVFVTAGGGAVFAFSDRLGLQLNLNAMLMLPKSAIAVQPSLGLVYGL